MAKASQEPAEATASEPVVEAPSKRASKSEPNEGTWPKSEHILHAEALYGRPAWLVEHVLRDVDSHDAVNVGDVQKKIDKYLSTPTVTEG